LFISERNLQFLAESVNPHFRKEGVEKWVARSTYKQMISIKENAEDYRWK